ncbi:MAG: hypothetical protein LBR26_01850 [Prevotella sp.]|nr:hypothetical protein [Prevotella sp.]
MASPQGRHIINRRWSEVQPADKCTYSPFGVASRYAGVKSRLPACTYTMLRSGSFAFSCGVARRYAERGLDGKSRRDDTLLTVGGA